MLHVSQALIPRKCCLLYLQRRFKYKKKWAVHMKEISHSQRALKYFDGYYKPVYEDKWPSIRVALLSRQKYCALANNFSNLTDTVNDLIESGGNDMLKSAANTLSCDFTKAKYSRMRKLKKVKKSTTKEDSQEQINSQYQGYENIPGVITSDSNIYDFMPPTRVHSEAEKKEIEERDQSFYRPKELNVHVIPSESLNLPEQLRVFIHDRGEVEPFPDIRTDSIGKLSHFMMDGASILPVLALDLKSDDVVLDLCSAPGGKALVMLQTMLPGQLVCVDESRSRLSRVKEIMRFYVPQSYVADSKIEFVRANGIYYASDMASQPIFDKVLVDVPCYTDRHVLKEDDNNLFKPGRREERLAVPATQKALLCAALKAVKPGGAVVYSTCTLSMPQNDGTVQAAIEEIWDTTDIDVVVEDTSNIVESFRNMFDFYPKCRFGQMVLPNLTANCGPMYFCKLRRLR